jgi:organic hydroperoxide reductase OsmC/OhrA
VRIKARVDIDGASPAELDALVAHAAKWSPVLNTVRNPVAISVVRA